MIKKDLLLKKTYSKPEIEFVAFNYSEIVSASEGEIGGATDIETGGKEEEEEVNRVFGFALPKLGGSAPSSTSVEDSEGEYGDTEDSGYGGIFGIDNGTSTDTNTEQQEVQAEEGGGFFDSLANDVSDMVNEAKDELSSDGGSGGDFFSSDDGGGSDDFSSSDSTGDTSSSGDSVWTE